MINKNNNFNDENILDNDDDAVKEVVLNAIENNLEQNRMISREVNQAIYMGIREDLLNLKKDNGGNL